MPASTIFPIDVTIAFSELLQRLALGRPHPIPIDRLGFDRRHRHLVNDHIVLSGPRHLPLTHVSAHGNVEQDVPLLNRSQSIRQRRPHDRSPIYHPSQLFRWRIPIEVKPHRPPLPHPGLDGPMLPRIFPCVETPMETRMVLPAPIPRLGNVHLALVWPYERLGGEQPESRPDACCVREGEGGR